MARRQEQREESRDEIREAARAIIVREGYRSFSMRKLASEIGASTGSTYLYFRNKEDLFRSLVDESFSRLNESLKVLADEPRKDPIARLKLGLSLYVDWGCRHPNDYQIAFLLPDPGPGPYKTHQAFDVLRAMVAASLPAGRARSERVEIASQAIWSAVHGITSLLIQRPSFPWRSKASVIGQVIDSAVDGAVAGSRAHRKKGHGRPNA
ncbi:MAG TPA: TetR/AcrR family transcriptional regulator [Thermoanaerobaculia bacterium]|nr:TetR/AcrR family transcriptional regulator [Thermoanaerobaculia bacterium]